jgi:hypothetical protein
MLQPLAVLARRGASAPRLIGALLVLGLGACTGRAASDEAAASRPRSAAAARPMNDIAESYVKLALALGVHDADYVDAYYGPRAWKSAADSTRLPLAAIAERVGALGATLRAVPAAGADTMDRLRHAYLDKQLRAMAGRIEFLQGRRLPFDDESRVMYDAVAPTHPEAHYRAVLARLDGALPGTGPVPARYEAFRAQFAIPRDRLEAVFTAAIGACRERTARHVKLPPNESFTVEYVTDKPWSAYNWYKGGYRSVIQVNTDLPIFIDRAVDLACHEGYPGHHLYNALLEQQLVRGRGWVEFSVYPLFSPQSLIAEGSANYGIAVAFPGEERVAFERERLFPLAGLDPARAPEYYRVLALGKELGYAGNEAARRYLDGAIDAGAAARWINAYALMEPARAAQRVRFIDKYRSYVINYNLGEDLVRQYVEARSGGDPERRWQVFTDLLSSPRLPSNLR